MMGTRTPALGEILAGQMETPFFFPVTMAEFAGVKLKSRSSRTWDFQIGRLFGFARNS